MLCYLESQQPLGRIFSSANKKHSSQYSAWQPMNLEAFPFWLTATQTISSPMWISRIVPSNPFRSSFPGAVQFPPTQALISIQLELQGRSSTDFQSSLFVLPSLFWYSAPQTLASVACLHTQLHVLNLGGTSGLCLGYPSWSYILDTLSRQQSGANREITLFLFFRGFAHLCSLMSTVWKHCFMYFHQFI